MDMKFFLRGALPAATLLTAVIASPAQASYLCTGAQMGSSSIYFNGDLTDPLCDTDEVEAALGITIDTSLIAGSKTNSNEETDPLEPNFEDIISWTQDEFGLGTLDVTTFDNTSGTWTLTGGGITPLFFVDKYDGGYDIYTYMGPGTDPFGDSWDGVNHGTNPSSAQCGGGMGGGINCNANTSHISVYGVVPVPAAVWLFGSGLLGLVGVARKRRS